MPSDKVAIRSAGPSDAVAITEILTSGFQCDPPLQWMLPDAHDRVRLSRIFFRPFVDLVIATGRAYITDDLTGAALWLDVDVAAPPSPDDQSLHELLRDGLGERNANRFLIIDSLFSAAHPGHESHAYLPFIGVNASAQGRGIGTALLTDQLHALDTTGRPTYLEASSERNLTLYKRLGFAPIGEPLPLPGGPSFFPMWRPSQFNQSHQTT